MSSNLMQGDCLELMKSIPDGSIDAIITDPPYGTTACKWDSVIPFEPLWAQYKRIIKDNGAIVLTASQPFTTALISSNLKDFKYCLVWDKTKSGNFALAKKQPMKSHEDICLFYAKQPSYNPQMEIRGKIRKKGGGLPSDNFGITPTISYNNTYYPKSILTFSTGSRVDHHHPTQKPVKVLSKIINWASNEGDVVFDCFMGVGSSGEAALLNNRKFIGFELEDAYFNAAEKRLNALSENLKNT